MPDLAAADLLVQFYRFCRWRRAQFIFENLAALLVLAQGGARLAGLGVEEHERAMRVLVERVQGEPAVGGGDSSLTVARGRVGPGQLRQQGARPAAQVLGRVGLPVVEVGCVRQREAGQKVGGVEAGGRPEPGQTDRRRRSVRHGDKFAHVDPQAATGGNPIRFQ